MKNDVLLKMLGEEGAKEGGACVVFAEEREASLLVALEGALLTVERLLRVEVKGDYLVAHGARERLLVGVAQVVGLRVAAGAGGTGFRA